MSLQQYGPHGNVPGQAALALRPPALSVQRITMEESAIEKRERARRYRHIATMLSDRRMVDQLIATAEQLEHDADKNVGKIGGPEKGQDAS